MRSRVGWASGHLLLVLLSACGGGGGAGEAPEPEPKPVPEPDDEEGGEAEGSLAPLSVDITIDGTGAAGGWLRVTEEWHGIDGPFSVRRFGDDGAYTFRNVRYEADGASLGVRAKSNRYEVRARPVPADLTVSYEVRPGVAGRHGAQGFADDRFAVFDGRALLLPIAPQPLGRARFRFVLPEGWTPATALVPGDDGWWVADPPSGSVLLERLMKECHGLGPWNRQDFVLGDTEVRSFVHAELEPELQERVMKDTEAVWGWFHDTIGFDPGYPMAFVRTPSKRGERIFGGASMMGACYEAEWKRDADRNTYLLGHRFGHPFNKYPPAGMTAYGPDDHWFAEGWASYAEVLAVETTGRMAPGTYFPGLWRVHRDRVGKYPRWLIEPIELENRVGADQREYLHYFRGPLLVRTLAHLVEERSDTDLEAFVRHLGETHGHHARPYHLQDELEAFTGARFDDFWDAYVRGRVWVVPSFPGIVDADVRDRSSRPVVADSVGIGVDANYLAALAASGRFHDVRELVAFVGSEGPNRRIMADAGVRLVPEVVHENVVGLPPLVRESIARAEAEWPLHLRGVLRSPVTPQLRWRDDRWARTWRDWAATAEADELVTLHGGIDRIALRVGTKDQAEERPDVLSVPPDAPFTLYVWWREPRSFVRVEVLHDDELVWSSPITEQPGWIRNRLVLDVGDRPAEPGVLTVRVLGHDGALLGQRRFLQWGLEAAAE